MLSRGKKREYLCPNCRSPDISKGLAWLTIPVWICAACCSFGLWRRRLKRKAPHAP